jgi:hypothetical protein
LSRSGSFCFGIFSRSFSFCWRGWHCFSCSCSWFFCQPVLLNSYGIFKDDPSFDEFVEAMAEERRRLYLEEMAAYDEEEIATEL